MNNENKLVEFLILPLDLFEKFVNLSFFQCLIVLIIFSIVEHFIIKIGMHDAFLMTFFSILFISSSTKLIREFINVSK